MAFYYFDASALVKYYVTEPGSAWVRQVIDERDPVSGQSRHIILVAEITRVEVAAGLAVMERIGRIKRAERDRTYRRFISQLAHRYAILPLSTADFATAALLTQPHPLKAYDAIQLATALGSRRLLADHQLTFTFVTGDTTLIAAAQAEQLLTDNPFDHVSPSDMPGRPG
jgi:predicted nucleic acid-binding protein